MPPYTDDAPDLAFRRRSDAIIHPTCLTCCKTSSESFSNAEKEKRPSICQALYNIGDKTFQLNNYNNNNMWTLYSGQRNNQLTKHARQNVY